MSSIVGPASYYLFGFFPAFLISLAILVAGIGLFTYIMARRLAPPCSRRTR